jgi:PAS domain S-box-containing protein
VTVSPLAALREAPEAPPGEIAGALAVLLAPGQGALPPDPALAGVAEHRVETLEALADLVTRQVGAVLIAEERLGDPGAEALQAALAAQPAWSALPFVVLAQGDGVARDAAARARIDALGNAVLLPRGASPEMLARSLAMALKARARQHDTWRQAQRLELLERQLFDSEAKFEAIADSVDPMIWSTRPDGFHDYYNHRWYSFTGVPDGSTDGEAWNGMFHPEDQERAWSVWRHSLKTGEPYEIEYRLRHHSGQYRWVLGRALPVRDATGAILRWYGTCTDIHEIKVAAEQRKLMLAEMNHRVKNTLAMVHSIVSQTLRHAASLEDARVSIQSRIGSMSQAHDRLVRSAWMDSRLSEIVEVAIAPHRAVPDRFSLEGPDLAIGSKQALALTMALHELATNAAKYGALSGPSGRVEIRWSVSGEAGAERFAFGWTETEGPPVTPPSRVGFGTRMIEKALAGYFGGQAELAYDPEGLTFRMSAPLKELTT